MDFQELCHYQKRLSTHRCITPSNFDGDDPMKLTTSHPAAFLLLAALTCGLLSDSEVYAAEETPEPATKAKPAAAASAPKIQMAILLDTSGSMQGLINQARTQLWKIVNELATTSRDGQTPNLEVALYEYGKSSLPKDEHYLRQIVPLSDDLDKLSEELFALSTNGGEEYCGAVISKSVEQLEWSKSNDDLKLIFIAGNEPFSQGPVAYKDACQSAIEKGITVSTIFCGPKGQGLQTGWADGAKLADGSFLSIDQNQQAAAVATPFDDKLSALSGRVNRTYLTRPTADGLAVLARQKAADSKAAAFAPAAGAERAAFKGRKQYRVAGDLVQELEEGKVKLSELKETELPEELRKLPADKREGFIKEKAAEREKIQEQIQELAQKRKAFIAEARKKEAETGKPDTLDTLDTAVIKAVREQAARKKFETPNEPKPASKRQNR